MSFKQPTTEQHATNTTIITDYIGSDGDTQHDQAVKRLRLALQKGHQLYIETHPVMASGLSPQEEADISEEIQKFAEWFQGLDRAIYQENDQVKIPIRLGERARKDVSELGFKLFYHHSSYSWFLDLKKTCQ